MEKLLTLKEVLAIYQSGRTRFYENPEIFPTPIRTGHKLLFRREDVEAKIQELAANNR